MRRKEKISISDIEAYWRYAKTNIENIAALKRYGLMGVPPEEETERFAATGCVGEFTTAAQALYPTVGRERD